LKKTFYSNGKLLLTAEYMVLDGATAIALPTKFGQYLQIEEGKKQTISWKSYDNDSSVWFEDDISFESIIRKEHADTEAGIKNTLIDILHEANILNPDFLNDANGYTITTTLTFPRLWGLGTSSTLINNIAQWLNIDAYKLLEASFGGSGYDIACAQHNTPILYRLDSDKAPVVTALDFNPDLTGNLYFVYLNHKQSSKSAIMSYYNKQHRIDTMIPKIDAITTAIAATNDLQQFGTLLEKHEILLSDILEMETVKERFFYDFKGILKSLGAWGGDFVLAVSKNNPEEYFKDKGFPVIIPYSEMIL